MSHYYCSECGKSLHYELPPFDFIQKFCVCKKCLHIERKARTFIQEKLDYGTKITDERTEVSVQ